MFRNLRKISVPKYLFILIIFAFNSLFSLFKTQKIYGEPTDFQSLYGDDLTSRFIIVSDSQVNSLVNIPLRPSWWSRFKE